jgi:putative endonuclease
VPTGTPSRRSRWLRRTPAQAGRDGERIAALLYLLRGYTIVGRDVRMSAGQVDLVCRRGRLLVVVEVKRRRTRGRYGAVHALSWRQEERLLAATAQLQRRYPWARAARIDLVAIDGWHVRIWRNAVTRERHRRDSTQSW